MHRAYLVDPTRLDIARRKAPSTIIGVELCASFTAAQVAKFLLGPRRSEAGAFPLSFRFLSEQIPGRPAAGNNGLLQRLKGDAVEKMLRKQLGTSGAELFPSATGR